jgi:hypothetical protein
VLSGDSVVAEAGLSILIKGAGGKVTCNCREAVMYETEGVIERSGTDDGSGRDARGDIVCGVLVIGELGCPVERTDWNRNGTSCACRVV